MSAAQYRERLAEELEEDAWVLYEHPDAVNALIDEIRDDLVGAIRVKMTVTQELGFSQGYDNGLYAAREMVRRMLSDDPR